VTETRVLDTGSVPERFARGWHCLGLERDFNDGEPHAVQAFGGKLVVWSDPEGELHVLDGYCRHMGGDLTQGTVKGDEIACPFHDWRWGGDGKCKAIPYSRRVPLRARTQHYESVVRNQQLMIWHDPEGGPPDHDALPPVLEGTGTDRYRVDLERHRGRQRPLPRDHRQRRRHGALLLHPLRLPDELPQRVRG
jgi:3-ketosteroid 9alpha-monooxygenase subunit A